MEFSKIQQADYAAQSGYRLLDAVNETNRLLAAIGTVLESIDNQITDQNVARIRQQEIKDTIRKFKTP